MMIILYGILGALAGLLDLVAFVALIAGVMTFFALDGLKPYRWYLIAGGIAGLIVMLPLADYFIGKAVAAILGTNA